MNTFVLHCKQYYKCIRLSDLSRDGMLHCRISCYCSSSGVCVCVCAQGGCARGVGVRLRVFMCGCVWVVGVGAWVYSLLQQSLTLGLML